MEMVFINTLVFSIPLVILLIFINIFLIIFRKKKISIIKTLAIPFGVIVLIIPMVHIVGGIFYSIKSKIDKREIEQAIEKNEEIEIMANSLISQFINNYMEADKYCKNKIIKVNGNIDYIGIPKDNPPLKDNAYVRFSDKNGNLLICYFTNNKMVPELKFNKENTAITIVGKYRKYKFIERGLYIEIGDCEIIDI
jgi:energy-coupling factor transporter transmembrane protein EcfT